MVTASYMQLHSTCGDYLIETSSSEHTSIGLLTAAVQRQGLQRRWKYSTNLRNQEAGGLTFSDEEWEFEWSEIIRIASNHTRRRPTTDSLRRYSTLRPH